jgi:murein L,D-transpeptidase YafK
MAIERPSPPAQPRLAFTTQRADALPVTAEPAPVAPPPKDVTTATPAPVDTSLLTTCDQPRAIIIHKARRELELLCGSAVAGRYAISLGFAPSEHKLREGDGRTPEGDYLITWKFASQFHRSLQVAYPNAIDAANGLADGRISRRQHDAIVRAVNSCHTPPQNTPLGSHIQVHGAGGGAEHGDWTLGCVALDNDVIETVSAFHEPGCESGGKPRTPLQIFP